MPPLILQFIRFVGLGFVNTGVGFALFNFLTFYFGKFTGLAVGIFSIIGFIIAVSHSYFWNRYLVFGPEQQNQNVFFTLIKFAILGFLGAVVIVGAGYGAKNEYPSTFYLLLLLIILIGEVLFWFGFRVGKDKPAAKSQKDFVLFISVTAVGALIQFALTSLLTATIAPRFGLSQGLWTYLMNAAATGVGMIWNFAGYKIFIFKK